MGGTPTTESYSILEGTPTTKSNISDGVDMMFVNDYVVHNEFV